MSELRLKPNGDPDPTIEQIEREIRRARIDESDTEKFVRDRAHTMARVLAWRKYKDESLRQAFIAGYRTGSHVPDWQIAAGFAVFIALAWLFSLAL